MVCFIIFCVVCALCLFFIYKKCTQKPIVVKSESVSKTFTRPFLNNGALDVRSGVKPSSNTKSTKSSGSVQHNTYFFEDVSLNSEKSSSRSNNSYTNEESNYSGSGRFGGRCSSSSWGDSSSDSCSSSSDSSSSSSSSCD